MTIDELVAALAALKAEEAADYDVEDTHLKADMLLLAFINDERVTAAFEALTRWYA